jgi:chemotaxis protein MotA
MEKSTPIGLVAGFALIIGAIFMGDGWSTFVDPVSFILVVGGTTAALCVGFSFEDLKRIVPGIRESLFFVLPDLERYVHEFSEMSRVARREGLLALDRRLSDLDDEFMRFGLEMAVDGIEEEEIESLLRERTSADLKGRQLCAKFFTSAGTYAPAFGMVGTLIGLIQMLQNLSDPTQIGSGMAVALITTFYGALLANLVFLPFSTKIRAQTGSVLKAREMIRTGVLAIVRGESPSMIEKRLRLFVEAPSAAREEAGTTPLQRAA